MSRVATEGAAPRQGLAQFVNKIYVICEICG
jgi:hypothetical protein